MTISLFYAPGVCSLPPHVILRELGIPFDLVRVNLRTKQTDQGADFLDVNPKGYVPALRLPDIGVLTETAVILKHLADTHPTSGLAPSRDSAERLRFDESMHFVAAELHKGFLPLTIMAGASADSRAWTKGRLEARVELLGRMLGAREYFHGESFTVLDAYLFWALRTYARLTQHSLPAALAAFQARIAERASVTAALAAEAA